ncbi:hypothetical protein [Pseudomonas asplenii]|uniref:hypothetical protein n=1 Tax=Pseudomonas asplenii TaxID=53407 RepID=UPI002362CA1F|nr:hypothetical protein [Pseudomonas asplenii]
MITTSPIVITVRLSSGTYTARARGEKTTASSTINAEAAAKALATKLGIVLPQLDLFADSRSSSDQYIQYTAQRSN